MEISITNKNFKFYFLDELEILNHWYGLFDILLTFLSFKTNKL